MGHRLGAEAVCSTCDGISLGGIGDDSKLDEGIGWRARLMATGSSGGGAPDKEQVVPTLGGSTGGSNVVPTFGGKPPSPHKTCTQAILSMSPNLSFMPSSDIINSDFSSSMAQ